MFHGQNKSNEKATGGCDAQINPRHKHFSGQLVTEMPSQRSFKIQSRELLQNVYF